MAAGGPATLEAPLALEESRGLKPIHPYVSFATLQAIADEQSQAIGVPVECFYNEAGDFQKSIISLALKQLGLRLADYVQDVVPHRDPLLSEEDERIVKATQYARSGQTLPRVVYDTHARFMSQPARSSGYVGCILASGSHYSTAISIGAGHFVHVDSRTGRGGHLSGMLLDSEATAETLVEEIRTALWQNLARSSDLMRELDTDGSGTIGVGELRRALLNLGLSPSSEVCQQLFDSLDEDGSGQIDFKEQRTGKATVAGPEEPHGMPQSKWSLTELPTWDEDDEREAELLLMPAPAPPAPRVLPPPPAPPPPATLAPPPPAPPAPPTSRPWDEHVASGATGGMGDAEYSLEQEKMLELYGKILQQYERHVAQMNGNEIRLLRETRRIRTARRPGMAAQLRGLQERTAKQVARDEERERRLEAQLQLRLRRLRDLGIELSESELRLRFGLAPGFDADAEEARQMSIERQLELARAAEVAQAEALLAAQSQLGALAGEKARLQQQAEAERTRLMHDVESERARIAELERLREEERLAAERAKALLVSDFDAEREALLERLREAERLLNEKLARDLAHNQAMQQAVTGERLEKSLFKRGINTQIQDVDELREAIVNNQSRISDLFREWDADGNGTVDLQEFTRALIAVGLPADPKAAEALFREFDVDGSGNVEYKEYLRYSLREMLQRSAARVMDLLHKLDPTGRGAVDLPDFIKGVKQMGYDASDEDLTMLFNEWDSNKSGLLEFKELNAQMRRTGGSKGPSLTKQAAQLISRTKKNMITSAVTAGAVAGFSTVASAAGVVIVESVASPSQAC
eukprot:jgi/Chrpa1/26562/Chrysochromulina_OHIO_Genome00013261-RA